MSLVVGSVAPFALRVVVDSSDFDLSTAISAAVCVKKPDGKVELWSATIASQSAAQLTMDYVFVVGNLNLSGTYGVEPQITLPSGDLYMTKSSKFSVRDKFS